jgi:hypothetical protein
MVFSWTPLFVSFHFGDAALPGKPDLEIATLLFCRAGNRENPCRAHPSNRRDIPGFTGSLKEKKLGRMG